MARQIESRSEQRNDAGDEVVITRRQSEKSHRKPTRYANYGRHQQTGENIYPNLLT